jgi:hypothetical protein
MSLSFYSKNDTQPEEQYQTIVFDNNKEACIFKVTLEE